MRRNGERGAALIVGLLVALILLAIGALVVDVPRMERVGRMLQRAADGAALAGAAELNSQPCKDARISFSADPRPLQACWLRAKRAVFYYLQQNPVYTAGAANIPLDPHELLLHAIPGQNSDVHSPHADGYAYEVFDFQVDSGRRLQVQVTRMVYTQGLEKYVLEVPQDPTVVPRVELGTVADPSGFCTSSQPARCTPEGVTYRWANAMHVRLTLTGFPSMLAQLPATGIPATNTIMRESFSSPHHDTTEWP